jgi:hypothetical protein
MTKLIRWDTPFSEKQRPSVGLLISIEADSEDILKAIVAPSGIDNYPKYLVDFGRVVAFTCMEEAHSPRNDFEIAENEDENLCAYLFPNSPWLVSYDQWRYFFSAEPIDEFFHYLIFGGDNNIEVITPNVPTIRTIEQSEVLRIEYKI